MTQCVFSLFQEAYVAATCIQGAFVGDIAGQFLQPTFPEQGFIYTVERNAAIDSRLMM